MKSVLLVDDSPTILLSLSALLERHDYEARQAPDGLRALAALRARKADLVITDFHMPGMDGIELTREIRKLPTHRFVPVLLLTTESQGELRQQARAAGATGWLVKPVGSEALLDVLRKVLPS